VAFLRERYGPDVSQDMTIAPGSRLGPFEILAPLGAGGMGEVFRARDTRLDRIVAIKILPAHLSDKPGARERFEREARAVSSLNHPRICQLYDVGSQDAVDYLVMEYLEGETLAERLAGGPMPLEQALRIGLEICEGLERAHRGGVIHRDLKPGNIMLTRMGAKLMDFGLAKLAGPAESAQSLLETRSEPLTADGMIVGTVPYMSPEQVEGGEANEQSDIFSLGTVLYEMVAGKRAFEGKSQLSVASAILEKEPPPVSTLNPMTPPALERTIRTCLAKDPERRWQSVRDLGHQLEWIAEAGPATSAESPGPGRVGSRRGWIWAALAATVVLMMAVGVYLSKSHPAETRITRTSINPMADSSLTLSSGAGFALSPDGRSIVFVATLPDGKSALWFRSLDSLHAEPLKGTDGATHPFWSPDSRFLGFFQGAKLKKIEVPQGTPITLCDAPDGRGGTWNRQGEILFTPSVNSAIYQVSAGGGAATPVTDLDASQQEVTHRWPSFLPDGRHFIFLAGSGVFTPRENPTNQIRLGSLDSRESQLLFHSHAGALYASGNILFLRLDTLMAQPFDPDRLIMTGDAVPVADPVREVPIYSKALFSASEHGELAYVEGKPGADRQLVWLDRGGERIGTVAGTDAFASPHLSPDGKRILFYVDASGYDIWTYDIDRDVKARQTFGSPYGQGSIYPVWSPDGSRIAYQSWVEGRYEIRAKPADGSSDEEILTATTEGYTFPTDWSPDGKLLAYQKSEVNGWSMWMLPLEGGEPYRFHDSRFSELQAVFSPDGRWLAYCSNESGEYRVYVAPFPGPGGRWQVSPGGGDSPRWRRDGRELFYLSSDSMIMSAQVRASGSSFEVGGVKALFEARAYGAFARFDVTADGQRFIIPFDPGTAGTSITLVQNWPLGLER